MNYIINPTDIEKKSFEIITKELGDIEINKEHEDILKRVIHTTADFDYVKNLCFSENAVSNAINAIENGCVIITDTNMALSGINKNALSKFGVEVKCFMSEKFIEQEAKQRGVTRAVVSMEHACKIEKPLIFVIGNAPTALIHLYELIKNGAVCPKLVIGVPVGFVNVVESKQLFINSDIPHIIAAGRKGGSNVAAAIVNAITYKLVKREGF